MIKINCFLKVELRPRPWLQRYERQDLKGVLDLGLPEKFYKRAEELATPWEKYDTTCTSANIIAMITVTAFVVFTLSLGPLNLQAIGELSCK